MADIAYQLGGSDEMGTYNWNFSLDRDSWIAWPFEFSAALSFERTYEVLES